MSLSVRARVISRGLHFTQRAARPRVSKCGMTHRICARACLGACVRSCSSRQSKDRKELSPEQCVDRTVCVCVSLVWARHTKAKHFHSRSKIFRKRNAKRTFSLNFSILLLFFLMFYSRNNTAREHTHSQETHLHLTLTHITHPLQRTTTPSSLPSYQQITTPQKPKSPCSHRQAQSFPSKKKKYEPRNSHCCCPVRTPNWKTPQRKSVDASLCWKA